MEEYANTLHAIKDDIRSALTQEGFDLVGFARPEDVLPAGAHLKPFLQAGRHGDMGWLAHNHEKRTDPKRLWPDVKSVIVVALNYGPDHDPLPLLERKERGVISVYAQGSDYHEVIKKKLKRVGRWMKDTFEADLKVFVDTAPVMEKPLAAAAGIGWSGKHTNIVSSELGSWTFLGVIYSALNLPPDDAANNHCGTCTNCLDVCPTDALTGPFQMDARKCISYLTIECKGHIPRYLRHKMGNRIYGCDDCLAVCPWNKFAQVTSTPEFEPRTELTAPLLADYVMLDDGAFRQVFSKSPIKRIGRDRFVRNVLIAISNSRLPELAQQAEALLNDQSSLVRAMAVWACGQLLSTERFDQLRTLYSRGETDVFVADEWRNACTDPYQDLSSL